MQNLGYLGCLCCELSVARLSFLQCAELQSASLLHPPGRAAVYKYTVPEIPRIPSPDRFIDHILVATGKDMKRTFKKASINEFLEIKRLIVMETCKWPKSQTRAPGFQPIPSICITAKWLVSGDPFPTPFRYPKFLLRH